MKRVIFCPKCKRQHIDARWWAHKPHKTHHCRYKDCKHIFETEDACIGVKAL